MKFDEVKACIAIREAMIETIAHFGIPFVRTLSYFSAARKDESNAKP